MNANGNGRLRFGDFELDLTSQTLLRDGQPVKLQPQPLRILGLLLERSGKIVSRDELRDHLWNGATFVEFDQGLNYCIRQIRLALGDNAAKPSYLETLPKQGYRFMAQVLHKNGNGPTIEPAPSEDAIEHGPIIPDPQLKTKYRAWLIAIGCCALMALAAIWAYLAREPRMASLAVLPLNNFSGDPGQDYFADGMTDELTTMLAKNSKLRIVSATSAMQYKKAHHPLPYIAKDLGVDAILEGSILRSTDRIRLTVQLIDARRDAHIWAESFDRDKNDSASISSEVAQAVAKQLHSAVPQFSAARYVLPEAHDAYLHGRYLWFGSRYDEAGKYFLKASQLQPDYALAWTGVADYYAASASQGSLRPEASLSQAKAAALRAASLDDSLAQVHVTLCAVAYFVDWDWPKALRECDRGIDLDPKFVEAYHLKGKVLASLERHQEAIVLERKAMELIPSQRPWGLVLELNWARQYNAAIREANARLEATPGDPGLFIGLAYAYRCKQNPELAEQYEEKAARASGNSALAEETAETFKNAGYRGLVQKRLDDERKRSRQQYVSPVTMASLTAQLRDREQTITLLEQGYEEHSPLLLEVQFDPAYDFVHGEERYRSILSKMQLPLAH